LASFINKKYCEIEGLELTDNRIRSARQCRRDLNHRWGFYRGLNSNRPYCEGHERSDVIEIREDICKYFCKHKKLYYTLKEGNSVEWITPIRQEIDGIQFRRRILICHDESTIRTGDISKFKWMKHGEEPLFNKGRMRSFMESDFIVQHPSGPFLELSDSEFEKACLKYPCLRNENACLNYSKNGASSLIVLDGVNYFDNETILAQFERVFQLLEFKEIFMDHDFEFLVDNATTHTAQPYNINQFAKGIGYKCPVDYIDYLDQNDNPSTLKCFFETGLNKGKSKGLFEIAKELNLINNNLKLKDITLLELKNLLATHNSFKAITKLELLANKYGVKIIFLPKFHCEMSPIEGIWAHQKQWIRKKNDQNFNNYRNLINEHRLIITTSTLNAKLWRRFWHTLEAYNMGKTYQEVLKLYFGSKSKANIAEHRKIHNIFN